MIYTFDFSSDCAFSFSGQLLFVLPCTNADGYEGTNGDGWAELLDTTKCNFKISKTL